MISEWQTVPSYGYHDGAPPALTDIVDKKIKAEYLLRIG